MNSIKDIVLKSYFTLLKKLPISKNINQKILNGPLKGSKLSIQSLNAYLLGKFEIDTLKYLKEVKHIENYAIYDIGAHIGYYSMIFCNYSTKVYAFEPLPINQKNLNNHIKINNINNVEIFEMALSDSVGFIEFTINSSSLSNSYKSNSPFINDHVKNVETIKVKTNTIDNLIFGPNKLIPPSLLKIDVEGAEYDVLIGAKNTIETYKPKILLSTHEFHVVGVTEQCLNFLKSLGYNNKLINEQSKGLQDFYCEFLN